MDFDVAVLGLGAMGSAACSHLASRGVRTGGFERFTLGHDLGSSAGRTRIIRKAYFEHPSYVPLLERAYELWRGLEHRSHVQLLDLFGVLMAGTETSATIRGVERSAQKYGIPVERFDARGLRERYPLLHVHDDECGILEPEAGIVYPERGICAHLDYARESGAFLCGNTQIVAVERGRELTLVCADGTRTTCERAVICAGPWSSELLADLNFPLTVERNVQFWFEPEEGSCTPRTLPAYFLEREGWAAPVYGMPDLGDGVKFAFHGSGEVTSADRLERNISTGETERARAALAQWIPAAAGRAVSAKACMYTMTPDGHFAIGRHPSDPRIVIACGFSGHGYKFAPVIGEIVADLAMDREPPYDLGFLALDRFT
jgi:sarcosine oxidase